jgi:1,2-dihydroxy-3-keto-5-methylthiopentene dioxygenase
MAHVTIPDENRRIDDPEEIRRFLNAHGLRYERWEVPARFGEAEPTDAEILEAFAPEVERIKKEGGYVTADVINVRPEIPGLDAMMEKFTKEHTHSEDEVRFIVKGRGVFHIHPQNGPVFGVETETGDLISVPMGTRHWFALCPDKTIRAIRFFQDKAGWTPQYVEAPVSEKYLPVCFGPAYVKGTLPNALGAV